jgi:hypothetical protein
MLSDGMDDNGWMWKWNEKYVDNELQLMAGDRPQVNPIKVGNKPQNKSLFLFFPFIKDQMVFK